MNNFSIQDIESMAESIDVEFKAAQGQDGCGELPQSIWATYSSMANTFGGHIYLGIEETSDHQLICRGIQDTDRIQKTFWDTINSKEKVNRNILSAPDIKIITIDGKDIVDIKIPRANRHDRPIYLGTNPFGNTYIRRHEGDYKADQDTVRRMMAESVEDSRDDRILDTFGSDDLDKETINSYRHRFATLKPDHIWNELSVDDFLYRIGAMGKDRASGKTRLLVAGLLMFSRYETIKEEFPNYMVDYQERPEPKTEARWIDRILPDGTWSGNLYDFYQKTIRKLTADLKVPFKLESGTRVEDTPVHEALREALTNTLIHADYTGRVSILVVKRPDLFGFRNPGLMRVSIEQATTGGISDCRNHRIQDMFRYIGLGEHAGSGIPKIFKNWKNQHWRSPQLYEDVRYEQTLLELKMLNLMPEESIQQLDELFGDKFHSLHELERTILITAMTDGIINHSRIREISTDHPKDISNALAHLVQMDMLIKEGETRGSYYYVSGQKPTSDDLPFTSLIDKTMVLSPNSQDLKPNSQDLKSNSQDLKPNSQDLNEKLKIILKKMGYTKLPKKINKSKMELIILQLCDSEFIKPIVLASILERNPIFLAQYYLSHLTETEQLESKYPNNKTHPEQAYRTKQHP